MKLSFYYPRIPNSWISRKLALLVYVDKVMKADNLEDYEKPAVLRGIPLGVAFDIRDEIQMSRKFNGYYCNYWDIVSDNFSRV